MWFQTLVLDVEFEDLSKKDGVPGGFSLMVFDYDDDDYSSLIGRIWINVDAPMITYIHPETNISYKNILYRKPKWYNIIYDATNEKSG